MAQRPGVIGVSGRAFQAVEHQFLQPGHVGTEFFLPLGDGDFLTLGDEARDIFGRLPRGSAVDFLRRFARLG